MTREELKQKISDTRKAYYSALTADEWDNHRVTEALLKHTAAVTWDIPMNRLIEICNEERERTGFYSDT